MGLTALKNEDLPHYTYKDYSQWEGRWEVIHGIPYAMTPSPRMRHQRLSMIIAFQLNELLGTCGICQTYQAIDWQITDDTIVQPDILVVCGDFEEREKLLVPPALVIEILSPSTARKDKIVKYELYQNAGVKYYCMVEPDPFSVAVFTLQNEEYLQTEDFTGGKIRFDLGPSTIDFDFAKVFESTR